MMIMKMINIIMITHICSYLLIIIISIIIASSSSPCVSPCKNDTDKTGISSLKTSKSKNNLSAVVLGLQVTYVSIGKTSEETKVRVRMVK